MVFVMTLFVTNTSFGFTIPDDAKIETVLTQSDNEVTVNAFSFEKVEYSYSVVRNSEDLKIVSLENDVSGTKINCSSNLTSTEDLSVPESEGSYSFNRNKELEQINSSNYRRARDGLMWCLSK